LEHDDPSGANHDLFGEGLRKSLFNYMHGVCFDFPLSKWFNFKIPSPSISPKYIEKSISQFPDAIPRTNAMVVWMGSLPTLSVFEEKRGKNITEIAELVFYNKKQEWALETSVPIGEWLTELMPELLIGKHEPYPFDKFKNKFEAQGLGQFETFMRSKVWEELKSGGLLVV
jgi:hypothetical protein